MLSALLLGLAGSLHCVGMCAPLTLALPMPAEARWAMLRPLLVYHAGRLTTYFGLGLLFGLVGKGLVLAGWQQGVSVGLGVAMLLSAVLAFRWDFAVERFPLVGRISVFAKSWLGRALRGRGVFVAGMLNGVLPCGMVYMALAGAIASTSGWESGIYMAVFGFGTLPALLGVVLAGRVFSTGLRRHIGWAQPVLSAAAGLLLISRGLHLNLEAWDAAVPQAGFDCH